VTKTFRLGVSEVAIVVALWQAGMSWVAGLTLALLLVLFAGLGRLTLAMSLGPRPHEVTEPPDRSSYGPRAPLVLALGATAVVAFLATPVGTALARAGAVLGSGS
jgi:formate hydrogenlyase subunit 3/multisubunit Na+/H+ antiporter MnhD subunit